MALLLLLLYIELRYSIAVARVQLCLDSATLENDSKIAFFVPTKTLVDQQFKQFIKYLKPGYRCQSISGDEVTTMSLSNVVEVNDVLVMTPQILLNALDSNELPSLSVFSLLIFDECHHMKKHYPYNDIMSRYYVDEKLSDSPMSLRLPQVFWVLTTLLTKYILSHLCLYFNPLTGTLKPQSNRHYTALR